jgi:hypothetical protein
MKTEPIPMIIAGDSGARKRLEKAMEGHLKGDLNGWSHEQLVTWTANKAKEIAKGRNKKTNPNGWSPLTRLMRLKVNILGALLKRLEANRGLGVCYPLYKEVKSDMSKVELTDEEEAWLGENGIGRDLPDWKRWQSGTSVTELAKEVKNLDKLTCSKMRKELRLRHDEWTRKIQEEADKGKIGRILKKIIGDKTDFSLEVIYGTEGNITDADEVARTVTDLFGSTFSQEESSKIQDARLGVAAEANDKTGFLDIAENLKVPPHVAVKVFEGMQPKPIPDIGLEESEGLANFTPTLHEFKNYIKCLNPRSAGGPSGMTYLLVQYWPDNVKERVYTSIKEDWIARKPFKSWGIRILQVIPKNSEPKLSELRPLMLVEVMRKIWVGLIMRKIASFWEKWNLVDQSQHAYLRGKGTHTVLPQLLNCLEGARDFKTSIYLSSWDMKKAFDSVGRKFLLWCLVRLRIPKELASYMIGLQKEDLQPLTRKATAS